jgi:hypothetical protein
VKNFRQQCQHIFDSFNSKLDTLADFLELAKSSIGWYIEDLYDNKKDYYATGLTKQPFLASDELTKKAIESFIKDHEQGEIELEKKQLYLYLSEAVISRVWSEIEELLDELVLLLEAKFGSRDGKWSQKVPRVHFLLKRINNYGLLIDLDPKLRREIDALRKIRNEFVHSLGKDVALNLIQTTSEDLSRIKFSQDITFQFCADALETAKRFAEAIKKEMDKLELK